MRNRMIVTGVLGLVAAAGFVLRPWASGAAGEADAAATAGAGEADARGGRGTGAGTGAVELGAVERGAAEPGPGGAGGPALRGDRHIASTVGAAAAGATSTVATSEGGLGGGPGGEGGGPARDATPRISIGLEGEEAAEAEDSAAGFQTGGLLQLRIELGATDAFGSPLLLWQPGEKYVADLNDDGELDLFDLAEFQRRLDAGDMTADFDGDGALGIMDGVAFQSEMAAETLAPAEIPTTIDVRFALIEEVHPRLEAPGALRDEIELDVRQLLEVAPGR